MWRGYQMRPIGSLCETRGPERRFSFFRFEIVPGRGMARARIGLEQKIRAASSHREKVGRLSKKRRKFETIFERDEPAGQRTSNRGRYA